MKLLATIVLALSLLAPANAALTLQTIGYASTDADWTARVGARVMQDAFAIVNESVGTPNHANRIILAGNILREPAKWTSRFLVATAGTTTVANSSATTLAAVTDANIQTAVDSLLDGFASNAQ